MSFVFYLQSALEELALREDKQVMQQLGLGLLLVCIYPSILYNTILTEGSLTPQNVRKWAIEIVTRLRSLAQIRDDLKQFKLVQCGN